EKSFCKEGLKRKKLLGKLSWLSAQVDYATELRPYITKQMKKQNIQGMSIALVDDQEILWSEGFGFANVAEGKKADENTLYRVGSISKVFTAMAIMQLVEQGKLDLDAPVSTYIPEFAPKSHHPDPTPITTRHILTHQSGLPSDIMKNFFMNGGVKFNAIVDLLNEEYVCEEPNTIWSYSNAGFSLLGVIIERVSGEDFFAYTQQHLFKPMEMPNAYFKLREDMKAMYAMGYIGKGEAYDEPVLRDAPAGLMHANVAEMAHFMQMLNNGGKYKEQQILQAETLAQMLQVQEGAGEIDYDLKMGLCFFRFDRTDYDFAGGFAGHGGDTRAYHAQFAWLPEQKLSLVILTNSEEGGNLAASLKTKILLEALKIRKELAPPEAEETEEEAPKIKAKPKEDSFLAEQAGYYALGFYPIKLSYKKGRLYGNVQGTKAEIIPNNQGSYTPRFKLGPIPITQKDRWLSFEEVTGLPIIKGEMTNREGVFAYKIEPNEITETWSNRYGSYLLVDKPSSEDAYNFLVKFELTEKDGLLYLTSKEHEGEGETMNLGINPISDEQARVYGFGRNCGGTIFAYERDGKSYLKVWGLEFERTEE
ncbi:MAG: serine hydrolase domain-containing protein, partial [Bacteroidota bacterium]